MMRKASLLVSGALLMLAACNAEEEDPTAISTARTQMAPLVNASCDWMFGCCSADELVYQVGGFTVDADDCSERLLDAITAGVPLELEQGGLSHDSAEELLVLALSINEDRVDVDPEAVSECAKSTRTRDCNIPNIVQGPVGRCIPSANQAETDPCDPNEMFTGKQAVGDECDGAWECAEGLRCVDFGVAGVCAKLSDEGEGCFTDDECSAGLVCNYASGVCEAGAKAGESCMFAMPLDPVPGTETVRCADGLTCDRNQQVCVGGFCAPGSPCEDVVGDSDCPESYFCVGNVLNAPTCQIPGDEGAACSKADDCATGYCNPFDEVCGARLLTGEQCSSDQECQSGFCGGGLCNPSFGAGAPCPSQDDRECQGGFCDASNPTMPLCTAFSGEGAPCLTGVECNPALGLQCVDAICLSLPFPNGTTCADNSQCASRACFMGECATGAVIGAQCTSDGTSEPCILGSFCETMGDAVAGTCAPLRGSGESCVDNSQCWGDCIVRYGQRMCDSTPAVDTAWCDGP